MPGKRSGLSRKRIEAAIAKAVVETIAPFFDEHESAQAALQRAHDDRTAMAKLVADAQLFAERIRDMAARPRCPCGLSTGTAALKLCAEQFLLASQRSPKRRAPSGEGR